MNLIKNKIEKVYEFLYFSIFKLKTFNTIPWKKRVTIVKYSRSLKNKIIYIRVIKNGYNEHVTN